MAHPNLFAIQIVSAYIGTSRISFKNAQPANSVRETGDRIHDGAVMVARSAVAKLSSDISSTASPEAVRAHVFKKEDHDDFCAGGTAPPSCSAIVVVMLRWVGQSKES